ncbi:MAG TPA: nucleotidyltransferase [Chloroflexi bacterium]|nr:nucleotidyltransferase [Chloroflexota bacterium]
MKVVIPLAGLGTRLRPHTHTRPKPLVTVAGKPIVGHILDQFKGLDVEEYIFIVGHLGEQIRDYIESQYNLPKTSYFVQKELKGQSHAIWLARERLGGPIIIIYSDTIAEADLSDLDSVDADGIFFVKEVEDPRRFGVAQVEGGYVKRLIEKPTTMENKLAVIGLYYIKDSGWLLECIEEQMKREIKLKDEYYLADAFQIMIERGARFIPRTVEVWKDCGKPETLLDTNRYLLEKNGSQFPETEGSIIITPVHIAPTAHITRSIIGPYVSIADNVVIEESIIRDSIINEGARIERAVLAFSLIGSNATFQGTCQQLNVGDSSQVRMKTEEEIVSL